MRRTFCNCRELQGNWNTEGIWRGALGSFMKEADAFGRSCNTANRIKPNSSFLLTSSPARKEKEKKTDATISDSLYWSTDRSLFYRGLPSVLVVYYRNLQLSPAVIPPLWQLATYRLDRFPWRLPIVSRRPHFPVPRQFIDITRPSKLRLLT